ncbi:MAG: CoA transferase [Herpetosiphonaceae bacterium]|nr:MAG: CoA transferase [Herpetosiphonaceae bacterium]
MDGSPLDGTRILDLSRLLPGPYATLLLACLGAEVVKIEAPGEGDYLRGLPPLDADGMNPVFSALNRGKRSVALNLRTPDGRAALMRLAKQADVLVESFRPGVLARLGIDLTALREANPRLVTCSISGYAPGGPAAERAGHDLTYEALAGALDLRPVGVKEPQPPALPLADLAGGLFAALAILSALLAAQRSGRGRHIALSLEESIGALLIAERAEAAAGGRPGNWLRGARAGYRLYRCGDGRWLALAALEAKFWLAFCQAVGRPEWIARFADADQQTLAEELAALFVLKPAVEWVELLQRGDVPCDLVLSLAEARDYRPLPFALTGMVEPSRSAPALGADTEAFLLATGYSAAELRALRSVGAIP